MEKRLLDAKLLEVLNTLPALIQTYSFIKK
jgi:hypothetical protein